jgi:LAS superfamily LD-carboxypeptidase LdcB
MFLRAIGGWLACLIGGGFLASSVALAAAPHSVLPGTPSSISAATTLGAETSMTAIVPAAGMGHVPSPYGELHLVPAAANAWNAMRAEAQSVYGIDIYPGGPLSAYRTYAQQSDLYAAFLAGHGAPANPPGTSSHESGTAVDVQTPDMRWVIDQIGSKYGWGKAHAPGEWWHVDYLGG